MSIAEVFAGRMRRGESLPRGLQRLPSGREIDVDAITADIAALSLDTSRAGKITSIERLTDESVEWRDADAAQFVIHHAFLFPRAYEDLRDQSLRLIDKCLAITSLGDAIVGRPCDDGVRFDYRDDLPEPLRAALCVYVYNLIPDADGVYDSPKTDNGPRVGEDS